MRDSKTILRFQADDLSVYPHGTESLLHAAPPDSGGVGV